MTEIVKERVGMSKRKNRDFGRAAWLDDGALTEILLRLPVKSVIRFQSVSKSWLSLISSDQFRRLHTLRRHKPPPSLILDTVEWIREDDLTWLKTRKKVSLFYSKPKRIEKLRTMMTTFDKYSTILSCSNGLILMRCDHDYYVHNPTTMQSKKVSLAHNDKFIRIMSIHLVFDPSESPHYNIVCIRREVARNQIEVFSSESGMWRVCVEPFIINGQDFHKMGSCVRHKSFIFLNRYCSNYVYLFDIVKNVSELVVFPLPILAQVRGICDNSIHELNGCLYYCALFQEGQRKSSATLWKLRLNMDDPHCSEWEEMYCHRVHLEGTLGFPEFTFIAETMTVLFYYSSHKIVAYSFHSKTYKDVLEWEHDLAYVCVFKFGETLALP